MLLMFYIGGFVQKACFRRKFFNYHSVIKLILNKILLNTYIFFNVRSDLII